MLRLSVFFAFPFRVESTWNVSKYCEDVAELFPCLQQQILLVYQTYGSMCFIYSHTYTYDMHMYAAGLVESLYGNVMVYVRVYIFSCFVAHLEIADSSSCFTMIFV